MRRSFLRPASVTGGIALLPCVLTAASIPLHFEANRGQAPLSVDFIARGSGGIVHVASGLLTMVVPTSDAGAAPVSVTFPGARPETTVGGVNRLDAPVTYFKGNDPSRWLHNVPVYARVQWEQLYPGIDAASGTSS